MRDSFFKGILRLFKKRHIPFLVGGGYAFARYTGIRRDTKDMDLFIMPGDETPALMLAKRAGYKTYVKSPHWLAKIENGDHFVDLIYSSGNGACPVDARWFTNQQPSTLLGVKIGLIAPEEMIWSKAFIMERHRYDGADVAHVLLARAKTLDWERLIDRFAEKWPVLLSHLILFRFIYPQHAADVPDRVLLQLIERLGEASPRARQDEGLCRGTLLSFCEYLPDLGRGRYTDARLAPIGNMSQAEIDIWTAERK